MVALRFGSLRESDPTKFQKNQVTVLHRRGQIYKQSTNPNLNCLKGAHSWQSNHMYIEDHTCGIYATG